MAARGKTGERTKLVQFSNNKIVTDGLHSSFWDFVEVNGCKRVELLNNYLESPAGTETEVGKKGCFQIWSKTTQSNKPWTILFEGNEMKNMKVGLKIAHNSGFRSVDTENDDFKIDLTQVNSNVTYPFSAKYKAESGDPGYPTASADKWLPAGQGIYRPDNLGEYDSTPVVINPHGYSLVI